MRGLITGCIDCLGRFFLLSLNSDLQRSATPYGSAARRFLRATGFRRSFSSGFRVSRFALVSICRFLKRQTGSVWFRETGTH